MIPVYQPYFSGAEKRYVNECLDSTWISSKGEFITRFEDAFASYISADFATTVSNGTVALHLALMALDIGPGDEVIVPTFTYVASINTILQAGAVPVYVDSLLSTWQIDPEDVRQKITPKTKAIMAVHLYGLSCDMKSLTALCQENQLLLIEDCAEAFGTYYHNQHVGTFGDAATFSFFGNKTITTGEGGMVIAKEASVMNKARHLKNQGVSLTKEYWHDVLGYNYRMTNICAAIGLAQLEQADWILAKKRQIAAWYHEGLVNLPLILHGEQEGMRHSYWMCSILVNDAAIRDLLRAHLKQANIETRPVFHLAHMLPHCRREGEFVNASYISKRGINLPSSPLLEFSEIALICESIKCFFNEKVTG